MKKIIIATLTLIISFSMYAQEKYYYYKGEKIPIKIDESLLNVIVENDFQLPSVQKNFSGDINYKGKKNRAVGKQSIKLRFNSRPEKSSYVKAINELKKNPKVKRVLPYFERGSSDPIGTSDIFYVKLKNTGDTVLLKQLVEKNKMEIIKQVPYMPCWYILSLNNSSFNEAVDASN